MKQFRQLFFDLWIAFLFFTDMEIGQKRRMFIGFCQFPHQRITLGGLWTIKIFQVRLGAVGRYLEMRDSFDSLDVVFNFMVHFSINRFFRIVSGTKD